MIALRSNEEVQRPVAAATVAELAWLGDDGLPQVAPVTPLLLGDQPAVAYPYAQAAAARRLAAATVAALVLSDTRMTSGGWRPVVISGRLRLAEDRDGKLFADRLLSQELRKYPPARAFADSLLLRRENWWYLPRLILTLQIASVTAVAPRTDGTGEVLAVAAGGDLADLRVDTVRSDRNGTDRMPLHSLAGRPLADGAAALLGHDFSTPDLEIWTPWTTRGPLAGGVLTVRERPEHAGLAPVPTLWERLRRHRELERGCRCGIAESAAG